MVEASAWLYSKNQLIAIKGATAQIAHKKQKKTPP